MKRRSVKPPFEMNDAAVWQWHELQQELGGIRGKGYAEWEIFRLAVLAEHQADFRRGHICDKHLRTMQDYREYFGLPPMPPVTCAA